jgi:hypothetical protein
MIGCAIKEDKEDAISELHLFAFRFSRYFPFKTSVFISTPCTPSVALNDQFEINCFMIGCAIKEDQADAISKVHLFAKASDSHATFPLKQANLCPPLQDFSCIKRTV